MASIIPQRTMLRPSNPAREACQVVTIAEAAELLASPFAAEDLSALGGPGVLVVDVEEGTVCADAGPTWAASLDAAPCVTVAALGGPAPGVGRSVLDPFDVVVAGPSASQDEWVVPDLGVAAAVTELEEAIARRPGASLVAVQILRASLTQGVSTGLRSESMAYSLLQSGPEFGAWLAARPPPKRGRAEPGLAVLSEHGAAGEMTITLNRPHVHNAVNVGLRDSLVEALRAASDLAVRMVVLRGAGSSFCSGGDLDEFGSLVDPVTAHMVRTARSPASWVAHVADRLRVEVHGAAVGAGAELAAFAGLVEATEDAYFQLPETSLGLIPGSGGTVSIPRRVGRQRAAFLTLTGRRLDAGTALAWGLVDRLVTSFPER